MIASHWGRSENVKYLLEQKGINIFSKDVFLFYLVLASKICCSNKNIGDCKTYFGQLSCMHAQKDHPPL